jgi:MerR family transcriptional regulator/heat shock protein HspR
MSNLERERRRATWSQMSDRSAAQFHPLSTPGPGSVPEPNRDVGTNGPENHAGTLVREDVRAVYVISVAAELAGVHPQTLRIYERKGLVDPSRTGGGSRRYSPADIDRVRHIGHLTAAGLNLEGVRRVLEFEAQLEQLRIELDRVRAEAAEAVERTHRQYRRDLVPLRQASLVRRNAAGRSR